MKLLVCGGRDFGEQDYVNSFLDGINDDEAVTMLIHGGAAGADSLAGWWAQSRGIHTAVVSAMWSTHGPKAGPLRNRAMLILEPKLVVAFPGGRGTASMVALARNAGIAVIESWK